MTLFCKIVKMNLLLIEFSATTNISIENFFSELACQLNIDLRGGSNKENQFHSLSWTLMIDMRIYIHFQSTTKISTKSYQSVFKILLNDYKYPVNIFLLKINNINTRKRCEICLKLTIKTPGRCHWRRSGVFNVTFEHVSRLLLVFLLLTLNR